MNRLTIDDIDRRCQEAAIEDAELLHGYIEPELPEHTGRCGRCQFWNSGFCMLHKTQGHRKRKPVCETFKPQ